MPITCAIELYCTAAKAPDIIREAMMGVISSAAVQIKLPTGYVMSVPVTWIPGSYERPDLPEPLPVSIAQEFLFPVDKQIRAFCRQHDLLRDDYVRLQAPVWVDQILDRARLTEHPVRCGRWEMARPEKSRTGAALHGRI